jgi:hypothetical protein
MMAAFGDQIARDRERLPWLVLAQTVSNMTAVCQQIIAADGDLTAVHVEGRPSWHQHFDLWEYL